MNYTFGARGMAHCGLSAASIKGMYIHQDNIVVLDTPYTNPAWAEEWVWGGGLNYRPVDTRSNSTSNVTYPQKRLHHGILTAYLRPRKANSEPVCSENL
jgi:hypothetical protein